MWPLPQRRGNAGDIVTLQGTLDFLVKHPMTKFGALSSR